MIDNMLTKECIIFNISNKNSGGFIASVDDVDDGARVKCAVYQNSTNYSDNNQEYQRVDLTLLIKSTDLVFFDIKVKQIVQFENERYKILNIKKYTPYANYIKNNGLRLELIKYDNF